MKNVVLSLAALQFSASVLLAGNFFGTGPWASGWYYPGQMDGKYQASVTGVNIAGAVGFAFRDGAPTVSTNSTATTATTAGGGASSVVQNNITVDPTQNYFLIFVQGMTYSGITTAAMNVDQSTVTGAMYGGQSTFTTIPVESRVLITDGTNTTVGTITTPTLDNLSLLNRGVNGGFTANIDSKKAVFTFSGTGELSSPAFPQSVLGFDTNGNVVPPSQFVSNAVTAVVETATVPFDINGIKVSFSSGSTVQTTTGN
jgi:hypothetical protein